MQALEPLLPARSSNPQPSLCAAASVVRRDAGANTETGRRDYGGMSTQSKMYTCVYLHKVFPYPAYMLTEPGSYEVIR